MKIEDKISMYLKVNEENEGTYKEFFNKMLDKFGVSSPEELDDDEKKDFYDQIDAGWTAKKETD